MKLSAIHATNFRSYKTDMALDSIGPLTVIIGPNNAGKSNIIELLTWYRTMLFGQGSRSSAEMKHTGNKPTPLSVRLEFEVNPEEKRSLLIRAGLVSETSQNGLLAGQFLTGIRHSFVFDQGLEKEEVEVRNLDGTWLPVFGWEPRSEISVFWRLDLPISIQRSPGATKIAPAQKIEVRQIGGKPQFAAQWELAGTFEQRIADLLRGFVQRWQVIPAVRQITPRMDPSQDFVVQQGGANLVRVLNAFQTEEGAKFAEMMSDVYAIVPDLVSITAPLRGNEATAVIREPGGVQVEAHDLSTGLKQTLILVTSLLTYPKNSLILVEEPEIHLHAGSQRALLRFVKRMTRDQDHQFLLTTHSTIFAEVSSDVSTYLVEKRGGTSGIHLLTEGSELKHLKEVLGHENTDLFGYNAVLVVEGETEETAIPILARARGLDLTRQGVRIINIRGKGKTTRLQQLLAFLKSSDTVPFIMLDGSDDVRTQVNDWVREGLVKPENAFIWDRDFEDCFDDSLLAKAVEQITAVTGEQVNVAPEELAQARQEGKTVFSVLERLSYEKLAHGLSKPALGEKLAELLGSEGQRSTLTPPQKALDEILHTLTS